MKEKNCEKQAREVHAQATLRFDPMILSKYAEAQSYTMAIVNKDRLLEEELKDPCERALLLSVFNTIYKWDYSTNFDKETTVYFEFETYEYPCGDIVYGGIYNSATKEKMTRVPVVKPCGSRLSAPYTYTERNFTELCKKLFTKSS